MVPANTQCTIKSPDVAKAEWYRLIGEGYKAVQAGDTSTLEEVTEHLKKRREERG